MRRIAIVAFPRVQTLDVLGPAEVFSTAAQLSGRDAYRVEVVASGLGPLRTSSVALHPDLTIDQASGPVDTLVVAAAVPRPTGPPAPSWPAATRSWRSTPTRSSCATAT